jgi:translation initiation factor IF-2
VDIDKLLEMVALEGEMLELRARPASHARGVVLEAHVSEGRGVIATVLVQDGTLKRGDIIRGGDLYLTRKNITRFSGDIPVVFIIQSRSYIVGAKQHG